VYCGKIIFLFGIPRKKEATLPITFLQEYREKSRYRSANILLSRVWAIYIWRAKAIYILLRPLMYLVMLVRG
jgi:hypothetical protein